MPILKQAEMQHFYLRKENGDLRLSTKHDYYYQIQGQLNVTGIDKCDLVVFVPPADLVVVPIQRDNSFFQSEMLPKLSSVWFKNLLPEFVKC